MDGMLKGLRVVEGSTYAAVAHGGRQLVAWGADVIRVEPIGGATMRLAPALKRGKRSIAIDIRQPRGQALLAQLITAPGAQAGAWCTDWPAMGALAPEALKRERDDLLSVHLPDSGAAIPAAAGPGVCSALLAALFHRERRGTGRHVTLACEPAGVDAPPSRPAAREFATRDGQGVLIDGLLGPRWIGLLQASGLVAQASALAARLDLNLADEGHRLQAGDALADLLARWFSARPLAEVAAALDAQRVGWRLAEPADAVGSHTDAVLAEVLGLSPSQIGRLHDARLVAGPTGLRARSGMR